LHSISMMNLEQQASFVKVLQERALAVSETLSVSDLTHTIRSLGKMRARANPAIVRAVQTGILAKLEGVAPAAIPALFDSLMWACVAMKVRPDAALVAALSQRAQLAAHEFSPDKIAAVMLWIGRARLRADAGLVRALCERAMAISGDFTPSSAVKLLQGFALQDLPPPPALVEAMCSDATVASLTPENISFLW